MRSDQDEQRMRALRMATDVRSRRARLKERLTAGEVRFADLLHGELAGADWLASGRVFDFLRFVPKVGPKKANRIMLRAGIDPARTWREMTPGRREALDDALRGLLPGYESRA